MPKFRRAPVAVALALVLGGCLSDEGKDGTNAPLPRMSKEKAEAWAKNWTESMARTAKAEIAPGTATANFTHCVGKSNETADDGRFTLSYNTRAELPKRLHAEAVRAIREELKARGFEIVGYRSDSKVRPANVVDAKHPKDKQFVSAGDVTDELLTFVVNTPCLLPPDAEHSKS